jgi:hypothetical protein
MNTDADKARDVADELGSFATNIYEVRHAVRREVDSGRGTPALAALEGLLTTLVEDAEHCYREVNDLAIRPPCRRGRRSGRGRNRPTRGGVTRKFDR